MALTNAQKQARWRDKRNEDAQALKGTPKQIAENILRRFGVKEAKRLSKALEKRLRNIKPDCPRCGGHGLVRYGSDDSPLAFTFPCDCKPPEPDGWHVVMTDPFGMRFNKRRYVTKAEAEKAAEEWREYNAGLKRKPRGAIHVVTTEKLEAMGKSCSVTPDSTPEEDAEAIAAHDAVFATFKEVKHP